VLIPNQPQQLDISHMLAHGTVGAPFVGGLVAAATAPSLRHMYHDIDNIRDSPKI